MPTSIPPVPPGGLACLNLANGMAELDNSSVVEALRALAGITPALPRDPGVRCGP